MTSISAIQCHPATRDQSLRVWLVPCIVQAMDHFVHGPGFQCPLNRIEPGSPCQECIKTG